MRLTPADMGSELGCLAKRHPYWRAETAQYHFRPEQQNIDAGLGLAIVPQWPGNAAFQIARAPGLHTRADALLQ